MIESTPKLRAKKRAIKTYHPCFICREKKGFTWSCGCGFAFCTDCLDEAKKIGVIGDSHREWRCPDCQRDHLFAKG
ncbi:MAG: hypothetical protein HQL69_15985 [Magnetococcales bacterium]|nr:hypothetical protein [Magnetococcales bacterium]